MTSRPLGNTSTAVRQRRVEPADGLDDFPTPPFATRALLEHVLVPAGLDIGRARIWEPACNRGHMAAPLEEYAGFVLATDIADYSAAADLSPHWARRGRRPDGLLDFCDPDAEDAFALASAWAGCGGVRGVVTNPPFNAAPAFVGRALALGAAFCAMFVRTAFVEGDERYRTLFAPDLNPPAIVAHFAERVCLLKGRLIRRGAPDPKAIAEGHADARASSATSYSWLVWHADWRRSFGGTRTVWIPPCMADLERPGDYPEYPPGFFTAAAVAADQAAPSAPAQGVLF